MPNVVVVDDQATDRQILAQLIRNLGEDHQVEAFGDAETALERLHSHPPDLILVDYRMPGMDGLAFIRACGDLPGCAGIPVIIITVVHDAELRYQALEAGATDFLTKPLDVQECQARCRNLLTLRSQQLTIARHADHLAAARRRLSRALRMLSLGNELLVQTAEEQVLMEGMCRLVVEQGGYPLAWVGFRAEPAAAGMRVAASARAGGEMSVADHAPLPPEELVSVAETGQPLVLNGFADQGDHRAWIQALGRTGFAGLLVLPIRIEGHANGILAIYADQPDCFDADEIELLARTADNLGYGVAARRAELGRARAEEDADYLAHFDPLTGLANRTGMMEWLARRAVGATGEQVILLAINLDRFKLVNDTGGQAAGDQLLIQVVGRLKRIIREGDQLARTAGDEFALLLRDEATEGDGIDELLQDAATVAERVIQTLRQPFPVAGNEYYVGASIGISTLPWAGFEPRRLLQQGQTAMSQAKEAGGNAYAFYSGELTERHARRLSIESRLHRAVANGDFLLYYQPILDLTTGRTVAAEALLRWPQADGSVLGPESFIPVAEETGLMVALGAWVFREACRQAREWLDQGHDLYVSVNLSTHQLLSSTLTEDLERAMTAAGVAPERLELEVTEGAMMTDPQLTESVLRDLHERGMRIAVDDFGTGYSSMSRLKALPISTLKIDKDFVLGLPTQADDRIITNSIIQLAANLGMRAVAEGVESERHHRLLVEMGCGYGQGFYFSRPQPAQALFPAEPPQGD